MNLRCARVWISVSGRPVQLGEAGILPVAVIHDDLRHLTAGAGRGQHRQGALQIVAAKRGRLNRLYAIEVDQAVGADVGPGDCDASVGIGGNGGDCRGWPVYQVQRLGHHENIVSVSEHEVARAAGSKHRREIQPQGASGGVVEDSQIIAAGGSATEDGDRLRHRHIAVVGPHFDKHSGLGTVLESWKSLPPYGGRGDGIQRGARDRIEVTGRNQVVGRHRASRLHDEVIQGGHAALRNLQGSGLARVGGVGIEHRGENTVG